MGGSPGEPPAPCAGRGKDWSSQGFVGTLKRLLEGAGEVSNVPEGHPLGCSKTLRVHHGASEIAQADSTFKPPALGLFAGVGGLNFPVPPSGTGGGAQASCFRADQRPTRRHPSIE
jgi:hypothetical protein